MASVEERVLLDWILEIFEKQRARRPKLLLESVASRKARLKKLRDWIISNRETIQHALYADFKKPFTETDATEIFPVLDEIKLALSSLDRWVKPKLVDAPLTMFGTRSSILIEPKGVCLIIAPWNYPFNLCLGPLVSALEAGNSIILKPSEITENTSALIKKLCDEVFEEEVVAVCEGGVEVSQHLLRLPFDHIFFTGSPAIGKIVMKAAAEHLTSVTLELGGKSPVIVTPSANLNDAAERIAVAKFINNGQTCIAPDYILVHKSISAKLIAKLKQKVVTLFSDPQKPLSQSPHYARIVNEKHFERLSVLLEDAIEKGAKLELNGEFDKADKFFHPVILSQVSPTALVMEEEIFGPILPIVEYQKVEDVIDIVRAKPKPLSLYIFGNNKKEQRQILMSTSAGGVCVNDCAIHFLHHNLPFGGVNNSGLGKSHGYYGFLAFSNEKPVLRQRRGITSVKFLYPPYTPFVKGIMNALLKLFS